MQSKNYLGKSMQTKAMNSKWIGEFNDLEVKYKLSKDSQETIIEPLCLSDEVEKVIIDFISKILQQQRREILKEMEFNPETDNFELDVVKAEKIFSDLKENK